LVIGVLLGIAMVVPIAAPGAGSPTVTRNEPAIAAASPALVSVVMTYVGYVRDIATGVPRHADPLVFERRCTAVVVNSEGDALTASVCVRPSDEAVLANALHKLGSDLVSAGELTTGELPDYVARETPISGFYGPQPGQAPEVTISGWLGNSAAAGARTAALSLTVTSTTEERDGGAALLKFNRGGLPTVTLAARDPRPGDSVALVGFGTTSTPSNGRILRNSTVEVIDEGENSTMVLAGGIGTEARGGAVLDSSGRLVGLLDADLTVESKPDYRLIRASCLSRLLAGSAVVNRSEPADFVYQTALDAYFDGRYAEAVRRFDAVVYDPWLGGVETYRDRAKERLENEGESVENSATWLRYLGSVAAGIVVIVFIGFVARRARGISGVVHG
jgi:hypothetical protein